MVFNIFEKIKLQTTFLLIPGFFLLFGCRSYEQCLKDTITMPELENVKDGIYSARYKGKFVSVTTRIKVSASGIEEVDILKHETLMGKKAEILAKRIKDKQTIKLDAVSGATASSNAILKSVEAALKKGEKKNVDK
jgi:uncharacterized protein with FMN-binding domain